MLLPPKRSTIKQLDSKGLRLERTEFQGLFSWTASRRIRGRRASVVDTSFRLGCHQWSVIDAVNQPLKSGGAAVARWGCTRKVENLFRFAVAVYGLRCPRKLHSPVSSSVWVPQYFHGVGGFPPPIHPWFSLPLWEPPKALPKLGKIIIRVSRVVEVITQALCL